MAKFCGKLGFVIETEVEPGVHVMKPVEKPVRGDLIKNLARRESGSEVNEFTRIGNDVEIVADPYTTEHFHAITYLKFDLPKIGGAWKVDTITVNYPRLTLVLGGVYNGEQA